MDGTFDQVRPLDRSIQVYSYDVSIGFWYQLCRVFTLFGPFRFNYRFDVPFMKWMSPCTGRVPCFLENRVVTTLLGRSSHFPITLWYGGVLSKCTQVSASLGMPSLAMTSVLQTNMWPRYTAMLLRLERYRFHYWSQRSGVPSLLRSLG